MLITPNTRFGKLRPKYTQEVSFGSEKKIELVCDCGKDALKQISCLFAGDVTSCGKCNLMTAEEMRTWKRGKLRIKYPKDILPGSNKKEIFLCDCGKEAVLPISDVISGHTTSCGRCNLMTAEEMKTWKRAKLRMKYPKDILAGSSKKETWICDCGKDAMFPIGDVISGHTISCGKCNLVTAKKLSKMKFGKLVVTNPIDITSGSANKIECTCKCKRKVLMRIYKLFAREVTSCGKCNLVTAEELSEMKFGKLTVKEPQDVTSKSSKKIECLCDCGNSALVTVVNLFTHNTTSCGRCYEAVKNWYFDNKILIQSLKCPVKPTNFTEGGVIPLETIFNIRDPFKAVCPLCKQIYYPTLGRIKCGTSLTCGCSTHKISLACLEISKFIESLGLKTELEYDVNKFKYDIFVSSHNLLIEYNGLKWHSYPESKQRDLNKYNNAVLNGNDYLMIFEDEWEHNRLKIELLLKNKLNTAKQVELSEYDVKLISSKEARLFYDKYHYSEYNAGINYGLFYKNKITNCITFKSNVHDDWELIGFVSNSEFKINDAVSKLLKVFVKEYHPKLIISFSDNRFSDGRIYKENNFKFDKDVNPEYYWVNRKTRLSKFSSIRIKKEKSISFPKTQSKKLRSYRKIWDLGKKRWVLDPMEYRDGTPGKSINGDSLDVI